MPAPTPYGVPAGTVVAWSPSADRGEVEIDLANRVERIIAPAGWALCDGTNGTPNMVDRFARGTVTFRQIGQLSGSSAHVHPFSGHTTVAEGLNQAAGRGYDMVGMDHRHSFNGATDPAEHVPPCCNLVYIMKLRVHRVLSRERLAHPLSGRAPSVTSCFYSFRPRNQLRSPLNCRRTHCGVPERG